MNGDQKAFCICIGMICLTLVMLMLIASRCDGVSQLEQTKRQYITGTNQLHNPIEF